MARQTSIRAYNNEVKRFKKTLYFKILDKMKEVDKDDDGLTRGEIAYYSKLEKSTVSARVNEMLKLGILQEVGRRKDKISNIMSYTIAINKNEQGRLF